MTTRTPMMAANWKMYKNSAEAVELVREVGLGAETVTGVEMVVCPPFTALKSVATTIEYDKLPLKLGAQNMHWEAEGAYTGEVSPAMLKQLEVEYVIIGHSERRRLFGETDKTVNKKIKSAGRYGLLPIFCVGETLEERDAGQTHELVSRQVIGGLEGIEALEAERLVVAYEPVWAIGTGRVAGSEEANDVIRHIRSIIASLYDNDLGQKVRILYGGSVKPENIASIMGEPEIDGALVGGASLDAESFLKIVKY